ncbi:MULTISPECIES: electron transfer flavoprotein alpha/beta- subunit [Halolamina]|uniref:Electron transfer flavoprotein beta subunit n=1 Tax=Halolamina pelagica TaxID=699431 RepID=A0A1I5T725_9EURY|nr:MULTISPECIES: electron transfer flavoprotein alpha/beta- subunit [Halolamina]NHX37488.1 electron transfer flavoprotein alpha/beta- subunit [Halolamina sp. R1-12]SFP78286.1 electron transfer flavoprotein beta subunit [Halolamina pelagica]
MKAIVATRPEPHRVVDDDGNAEPYRPQLSIDDRVALAAAHDVAEEVTAVGIGGDPAKRCVRAALERGADEGLHVAYDPIEEAAGDKYATVLARVAARESPDVVVVGQSSSFAGSEIATFVGEQLDWPAATRVTRLGTPNIDTEVTVDQGELAVQRKLAIGRQEAVVVESPTVLGIDAGYTDPDRAPLSTIVAGQQAEIETVPLEDVAPGESRFSMSVGAATMEDVTPNERWGRGRPPRTGTVEQRIYRMLGRGTDEGTSAGERIDAPPEEAAEQVVDYLRRNELL